jgi:hypothetical protein
MTPYVMLSRECTTPGRLGRLEASTEAEAPSSEAAEPEDVAASVDVVASST